MTTRETSITIACLLQALVSHTRGDFREANDCFCKAGDPELYRNSHESLRYMRDAVVESLWRDGLTPNPGVLQELDALLDKTELATMPRPDDLRVAIIAIVTNTGEVKHQPDGATVSHTGFLAACPFCALDVVDAFARPARAA